jgi:ABC-type transport system substrate-binding protein
MNEITFTLENIGTVQMVGVGPWRVQAFTQHDRIIVDANDREANPTVTTKFRPASNTTFARTGDAEAVVAKANELLAAQGVA